MTTWIVVPTRGDHPDLLDGIAALGYPTVVVRTADCPVPGGVLVVDDLGPPNIQRWWNAGLDAAQDCGATVAVVLNDDVIVPPGAVEAMVARLTETGAWLCGASQHGITGWAWALDVAADERPDERFRWWFGDNDLWLRAELAGRCTGIDVGIEHVTPNRTTESSPQLQALADIDQQTMREKWVSA